MKNNIVYGKNSWHYRLIVYIFTLEFFLEVDGIDMQAMELVNMEKDFTIKYKKKPRTVNLCLYCRAVVGAVIMFPFIVMYRLFSHKKTIHTHQEIIKRSQRNSRIVRRIAAGVMGALGIWHMLNENYFMGIFYFGLVIFNLFSIVIITWIVKILPQRNFTKTTKHSSKIIKTIMNKHDLICPPIYFIDKSDFETQT